MLVWLLFDNNFSYAFYSIEFPYCLWTFMVNHSFFSFAVINKSRNPILSYLIYNCYSLFLSYFRILQFVFAINR